MATKSGALGSFDMFGRDAERIYYEASVKRSKANYLSAEFQDCFGHALIEILRIPTSENEMLAVAQGLTALGDDLQESGDRRRVLVRTERQPRAVHRFRRGRIPKDRIARAGSSRTTMEAERDAILWTRKLANPLGEDYE